MRVDRGLIGWGVFFIVFGVVLLGVRQGWIPAETAGRAWQLWPVLLVAAGLSIALAGRPGAGLGGLVAATCFGLIAGGLVSSGTGLSFIGCGASEAGPAFEEQSGELPSRAKVSIEFRCGELSVRTGDGTAWEVSGASADGQPPDIERIDDGLRIEPARSSGVFGFGGKRERWDVTLPIGVSIALDVTLNAGEGNLVLSGALLEDTEVTVNAGSLRIDLREVEDAATLDGTVNAGSAVVWLPERPLEGNLTVNAGSLSICAPEGVGLRLVTDGNPMSSNDFDEAGLSRTNDGWESADFATVAVRIVLDVEANAGSMSLNPRGECAG